MDLALVEQEETDHPVLEVVMEQMAVEAVVGVRAVVRLSREGLFLAATAAPA